MTTTSGVRLSGVAGARYNVTPNVALDLDYRCSATDATFRVPAARRSNTPAATPTIR
jgi:opacity protein-like surface antigen